MAEVIGIKVEGGEELKRLLEKAGQAAKGMLKEAGLAGGEVIQEKAISDAPGPGIWCGVDKIGDNFVEIAIGPLREKWYYRFFEFGAQPHEIRPDERDALLIAGEKFAAVAYSTGGVAAQPFLRPALDVKQDEAVKAVGEVLWEVLERIK